MRHIWYNESVDKALSLQAYCEDRELVIKLFTSAREFVFKKGKICTFGKLQGNVGDGSRVSFQGIPNDNGSNLLEPEFKDKLPR